MNSERRAGLGAAAAVLGSLLAFVGACEKFTADGAGGSGGNAGAIGEPHGGSGGSAGSVISNGGTPERGGSGGDNNGGAVSAGAPSNGGASAGTGGIVSLAGAPSAGGAPPVSECPCSAPTPTCEAGKCVVRGPSMIKVSPFFIDSTEVTVAQYAVFAKLKAATPNDQAPECSWNTSYDPVFVQNAPMALPNHPVTNIDFCDAAAFCAWADKRLCGNVSGGPSQLAELADPQKSQWFAACAGPMAQPYPYGKVYQSGACNDQNGAKKLLEVGTEQQCQGYYPGLFDMLGNAQEWVDACDAKAGALDGCERIGGSYTSDANTECSTSGQAQRNAYAPQVGFRCCSK